MWPRFLSLLLIITVSFSGFDIAKAQTVSSVPPLVVIHHEQSQQANFKVVQLSDQLQKPWGMVFLPNGDLLISQKTGGLVRVARDTGDLTPISGAPEALVLGQGGLLGMALSPDFDTDQLLFIAYAAGTSKQNHTTIARGRLLADALVDLQVIFSANTDEKKRGAHFGSRLVFAPDGTLYASIGDGFSWMKQAQNPHSHFGKIIRINPDGSIPADNPFADAKDGAPEVWSYGHRNPQGLTLHPVTGALWQSEHGPKGGDEINILQKGGNFGWPKATFGKAYSGLSITKDTALPGMVSPILHWTPSIAPSGLDFYRSEKFTNWQGDLFSGALAGKHLRRIELDGQTVVAQEKLLIELKERIRTVRSGPDGFLYLLTDSGKMLRLEPD
ncbi:PQQ-dependent oxidoreductase, gdhB family [hydrothermal vent metagenome]|uniref:PQQ-dependent oxidoreductase, gdhB family n=1 Tax=hydrothermal vent metagenome TaxID=652676 RepID=A0A3B0RCK6_9ZZZZ